MELGVKNVRADRLLSIIMLLQSRGRMTAHELADELEVSQRTIYRDLDALSAAGIPVYTESGPGGGCELMEGYRTTLTGLSHGELQALLSLSIPSPLVQLGLGGDLKSALLKVAAVLSGFGRDPADSLQHVHIDWGPPGAAASVPFLDTLHEATHKCQQLRLSYRLPFGFTAEHLLEPYGLVFHGGQWFVVGNARSQLRVLGVERIIALERVDREFERPRAFRLDEFWHDWRQATEGLNRPYVVTVRVSPKLLPRLPALFGERGEGALREVPTRDGEGWTRLRLEFRSLSEARSRLLALGGAVEVLEPRALRNSVADFALQAANRYREY